VLSRAQAETLVILDQDGLPKSELVQTEFYNDFMKPFGMHSLLTIGLGLDTANLVTLNFFRPAHRPDFDGEAVRAARRLQPHLLRAYKLTRQLGMAGRAAGDLAGFLEQVPHAVFVLDLDGRIRFANHRAEAIIAERDGLTTSGGGLRAAKADITRKLQALIAAAGSSDPMLRQGGSMALPRPSARPPLTAIVAPLRSDGVSPFQSSPAIIVSVTDPDCDIALPAARLRQLFGLTRAEAAIALELVAGWSAKEVADRRRLSYHTVRAHTARILAKTETNRQIDLVRLLTQVAAI